MTGVLRTDSTTTARQPFVDFRNVYLNFGEQHVLDGVSLSVRAQERLVIIGQSGAGKTTILRLVLGILTPTRGAVFFKGHEVSRLDHRRLEKIRTRIGMVYQDSALLSSLTVRENLALP